MKEKHEKKGGDGAKERKTKGGKEEVNFSEVWHHLFKRS